MNNIFWDFLYPENTIESTINYIMYYLIALAVCLFISLIVGIVIYFAFLGKRNENKFRGAARSLYDFLSFKKLVSGEILKIVYIVMTVFNTLASFCFIIFNIANNYLISAVYCFNGIIVVNILLRIVYELIMMRVIICKNTTDIKEKLDAIDEGEEDLFRKKSAKNEKSDLKSQFREIKRKERRDEMHTQDINITRGDSSRSIYVYCPGCGQKVERRMGVCMYCGEIL